MELISREEVLNKVQKSRAFRGDSLLLLEEIINQLPVIESRPTGGDLKKVLIKYLNVEPKLTEAVIDLQGLYRAPSRPTGKWKVANNKGMTRYYVCSNCDGIGDTTMAYCPDCGAKMEG